jgi:hypothetical protein
MAALAIGVFGGCERAAQWTPVAADAPHVLTQAKQADEAVGTLATSLMAELQKSLASDGPAGAITFCKSAAPEIAKTVGADRQVRIGRTSFKLRNAQNTPPEWAKASVQQKVDHPVAFLHTDGRYAVLKPIKLAALCIQCHGPADQIAPDVKARLAEAYPTDQATGFSEGDLRGYFWVEVPVKK